MRNHAPTQLWIVISCLVAAILTGCEDKRRHQASEDVEFPVVTPPVDKDASAEDTALALLDAMKTLQSIRAVGFGESGNKEKYDQAMGLIASLMDKDEVYINVKADRSPTVPRDISRDAAARLVAEAWVSTCAHYLDSIDPGTKSTTLFRKGEAASRTIRKLNPDGSLRREPLATRETDEATVHVDAENPAERTMLSSIEGEPELQNAQGPDGKPLVKGSAAYESKLRELALKVGFNVPIRAQIAVNLKQTPEGWRAIQLWLQAPNAQVAQKN